MDTDYQRQSIDSNPRYATENNEKLGDTSGVQLIQPLSLHQMVLFMVAPLQHCSHGNKRLIVMIDDKIVSPKTIQKKSLECKDAKDRDIESNQLLSPTITWWDLLNLSPIV